jgi:hypothetical protein
VFYLFDDGVDEEVDVHEIDLTAGVTGGWGDKGLETGNC